MDRGFTKVPNILLKSIMKRRFSAVEMKLILTILRYTSGFMRDSAELSISMLAREIGSDKCVVSRHITRLVNMGVIKVLSTNPCTKVRILMINEDVEKWGDRVIEGVDQTVNSEVDQTVNGGVDQTDNSEVDQAVNYVYTKRSTNKDNINIILYKNIKERVDFSEKIDDAVIRWLGYKTERKEYYGKIPMTALVNMISEKVRKWGEDEVIEVIDDCIASGYKNIVWEKLKIRSISKEAGPDKAFMDGYDHAALEKLSRGGNHD